MLDPGRVTTPLWHLIHIVSGSLAAEIGFIVFAAFAFLMAHAIIPSLASTGRVPQAVVRQRPLFYILFIIGLGFAIFLFQQWVRTAHDALAPIWPRWAI